MKKFFTAFSLVEMLITLGIMSVVMLITTLTLNTIVKTSAIAKYKTVTRHEIDFAIELMDRLLSDSNIADVFVFDTTEVRYYDPLLDKVVNDPGLSEEEIVDVYNSKLEPGVSGNEIHIRPYGYSIWVCIGYFTEEVESIIGSSTKEGEKPKGYLVKRTMTTLGDEGHVSCFDQSVSPTLLVLNSQEVNVTNFKVSYIQSASNNNVFYVDLTMEPVYWVANSSTIEKTVFRQAVITTQGLTWY